MNITHSRTRPVFSLGPKAGSYRPPIFGLFRSSRSTGFTICLTDILRTSSVDKNENEMLETVDGIECEIFMSKVARDVAGGGGAGFREELVEGM